MVSSHLAIHQCWVPAAAELSPANANWSFFHVCSGQGYLLEAGDHHKLGAGDLVVLPVAARACLRSSQTTGLRLCHFGVRPEQLAGFFTARELAALRAITDQREERGRVFSCHDGVARQYRSICDVRTHARDAVVRCEMLRLAVLALHDWLAPLPAAPATALDPETRLRELVSTVPETELLGWSVRELAGRCGCSERHVRRLFHAQFGMPLLRRQMALRVERAKHLLFETDAKIIAVAAECGFRSLGFFNTTFKRMTGKTPTDWRTFERGLRQRQDRRQPPLCPQTATRTGKVLPDRIPARSEDTNTITRQTTPL